jgi:hypothetical protein
VGPNCDNASYPDCTASIPNSIGDGNCDGWAWSYNTEECGWDGGDCPAAAGFFGLDCKVPVPQWIGDGECHSSTILGSSWGDSKTIELYNTEECGWEMAVIAEDLDSDVDPKATMTLSLGTYTSKRKFTSVHKSIA